MSGHTYIHTNTHTYTHTYTHGNYNNPRCAHAHRGLIIVSRGATPTIVKRGRGSGCKPMTGIVQPQSDCRTSNYRIPYFCGCGHANCGYGDMLCNLT